MFLFLFFFISCVICTPHKCDTFNFKCCEICFVISITLMLFFIFNLCGYKSWIYFFKTCFQNTNDKGEYLLNILFLSYLPRSSNEGNECKNKWIPSSNIRITCVFFLLFLFSLTYSFFLSFFFSFLTILRTCSWLCAHGLFLTVLGRPYAIPGIDLSLISFKTSILSTVLSLNPHLSFP